MHSKNRPVVGAKEKETKSVKFSVLHLNQIVRSFGYHFPTIFADENIKWIFRIVDTELDKYRIHSRIFNFTLPEDPWLAGEPGPSSAVSDGYWVILEPLPPGKHEINFKASLTDPTTGILFYSDDLKYVLNVS